MENKSGLRPLGRAVLVKPYEEEKKAGMIVLPDNVKEKTLLVEQRAIVVEIGEACWPDEPPRAKVGDHVLVSKMAGYMAIGPADGERYRAVNDRDIFMQITYTGAALESTPMEVPAPSGTGWNLETAKQLREV